jgi:hypothetical protein
LFSSPHPLLPPLFPPLLPPLFPPPLQYELRRKDEEERFGEMVGREEKGRRRREGERKLEAIRMKKTESEWRRRKKEWERRRKEEVRNMQVCYKGKNDLDEILNMEYFMLFFFSLSCYFRT